MLVALDSVVRGGLRPLGVIGTRGLRVANLFFMKEKNEATHICLGRAMLWALGLR